MIQRQEVSFLENRFIQRERFKGFECISFRRSCSRSDESVTRSEQRTMARRARSTAARSSFPARLTRRHWADARRPAFASPHAERSATLVRAEWSARAVGSTGVSARSAQRPRCELSHRQTCRFSFLDRVNAADVVGFGRHELGRSVLRPRSVGSVRS